LILDQRALGTSLNPEKANLSQVRARFKLNKLKKEEEVKNAASKETQDLDLQLQARLLAIQEQEEKRKLEKKLLKKQMKEEKKKQVEEEQAVDPEIPPEMAAMGLPIGFGTTQDKGKR
jgi:U4/U6.U5 tri-snRNP component SNU23